MRSILALGGLALSGCMLIDSISPEVRFSDVVHRVNDEARWGRIDLASQEVALTHRAAFLARHRGWGRDVRVADVDVTNLQLTRDGEAMSLVAYQWIDEGTMELHATTVRQSWKGEGEGFLLTGETVVGGDAQLLPGAEVLSEDADAAISSGAEEPPEPPRTNVRQRDAQGRLVQ
jgi:hypothetical protein